MLLITDHKPEDDVFCFHAAKLDEGLTLWTKEAFKASGYQVYSHMIIILLEDTSMSKTTDFQISK